MLLNAYGDTVLEAIDVVFSDDLLSFKYEKYFVEYDTKDHGKWESGSNEPPNLYNWGIEILNPKYFINEEKKQTEIKEEDLPFVIDWDGIVEYLDENIDED